MLPVSRNVRARLRVELINEHDATVTYGGNVQLSIYFWPCKRKLWLKTAFIYDYAEKTKQ